MALGLEPEVTDTRNSEKPNVLEISGDDFIVGSVFHCEFTALDIEDLGVQDTSPLFIHNSDLKLLYCTVRSCERLTPGEGSARVLPSPVCEFLSHL